MEIARPDKLTEAFNSAQTVHHASSAGVADAVSDPPLGTLIVGVLSVCLISAYLLFDAYGVRQQMIQTAKNGRAYVARLGDASTGTSAIKLSRLALAVTQAKTEADKLKAALGGRSAQGQIAPSEIQEALAQTAQVERDLAEIRKTIEDIR